MVLKMFPSDVRRGADTVQDETTVIVANDEGDKVEYLIVITSDRRGDYTARAYRDGNKTVDPQHTSDVSEGPSTAFGDVMGRIYSDGEV